MRPLNTFINKLFKLLPYHLFNNNIWVGPVKTFHRGFLPYNVNETENRFITAEMLNNVSSTFSSAMEVGGGPFQHLINWNNL